VGIARGALDLTLSAQNEDTTVRQPLSVALVTPQCTASRADASLHTSPSAADQVIATIPEGTVVTVDAQDALGQWLRVQLAGGAHGWGERTAFTCATNFSVDDLYKELIVPTAPPVFTLVPTLSTAVTPTPSQSLATPTLPRPTTAPTSTRTRVPSTPAG
jgi:hypothetical protein